MMDLAAEFRRVIKALDVAGIPYAVVGGLAVSIYTAPRATEDIDLMVAQPDLSRAISAVSAAGFEPAGQPMRVAGGRLEIQRLIKIEGPDLLPLDLVMTVDPELTGLFENRVALAWEERQVWVMNVAGLRLLKRLRGSAQDRADLEALGPELP
jgi:hypothetical protein